MSSGNVDGVPQGFQDNAPGSENKMEEYYIFEPIVTFGTFGIIAFVVFCFLRLRAGIYYPRLRIGNAKPPIPPRGLFRWAIWLFGLDERRYLDVIGVDAAAVLLFFRMGLSFFCTVLPFSLITALLNYIPNPPEVPFETKTYNAFIRATTFENVQVRSWVLFIHLANTWAISIVAYVWILVYYRMIISLRRRRMIRVLDTTRSRQVEFRSIVITNVPSQLRDESALKNYYEALGFGPVEAVAVYRSSPRLTQALAKRYKYLNLLERQYFLLHKRCAKSAASRGDSSFELTPRHTFSFREGLVDEQDDSCLARMARRIAEKIEEMSESRIPYKNYSRDAERVLATLRKFMALDAAVRQERKSIFSLESQSSLAFVTFKSPASAITALQTKALTLSFTCSSRPAPEPRDICWQNIMSYRSPASFRIIKSWVIFAIHLFLVIFSASIIVAASFLVSARYLKTNYPKFYDFIFGNRPGLEELFKKFMPTIIASGYTSCLPSVLSLMSMLQGFEAKSWIETSLLSKYFFYQIYNIIIVQTIASSLWSGDEGVLGASLTRIVEALGNLVPANSPQFAKYVALHSFVVLPTELLTADSVEFSILLNLTRLTTVTPRNKSFVLHPSNMTSVNYGLAYPSPILIFCIGIICAPLAPFVVPFCIIYFTVGLTVRKYVLFYENMPKYEAYGRNFAHAVTRVFWGIILMQLTMMGGIILKLRDSSEKHSTGENSAVGGSKGPGIGSLTFWHSPTISAIVCSLPLLIITILLMNWMRKGYAQEMKSIPFGAVRYAEHAADERRKTLLDTDEPALAHDKSVSAKPAEICHEYSIYGALMSFLHPLESRMANFLKPRKSHDAESPPAVYHAPADASSANVPNFELSGENVPRPAPDPKASKATAVRCSNPLSAYVEPPSYFVAGVLDHPGDSFTALIGCGMYFWCGLDAVARMDRKIVRDIINLSAGSSPTALPSTMRSLGIRPEGPPPSLQRPDKTLVGVSPVCVPSAVSCSRTRDPVAVDSACNNIFKKICEYEDLTLHCYINPALLGRLPQPWLAGDLERDPAFTAARFNEAVEQWYNYCDISSMYLNKNASLIELHQDRKVKSFIKSTYFHEYQPDIPFVRHLKFVAHSISNWIRAKSR